MNETVTLGPMAAALISAGLVTEAAAKNAIAQATARARRNPRKRWDRDRMAKVEKVITWADTAFGTIRLAIHGVEIGETETVGATSWTPVSLTKKVGDELVITPRVRGLPHVMVGRADGAKFRDSTNVADLPSFRIPLIRHEDGTLDTTNKKDDGQNDFRIDLLNRDNGHLVVTEIGFTRWKNRHHIHQQDTYEGQLVMLTVDEAAKFGDRVVRKTIDGTELLITILPAHPQYAHGDANPFTLFQECRSLIELAVEQGCVIPFLSDWPEDERPVWSPAYPTIDPNNLPGGVTNPGELVAGAVMWENRSLQFGFNMTADGKRVFAHCADIFDWDGTKPEEHGRLPILHGMQPVLMKVGPGKGGKGGKGLKAIAIYPVPGWAP